MGYSFVNKVILYYDKPFWNKGRAQVLYIPKTFGTGLWDSIVCFYFEEDLENEKSYVCVSLEIIVFMLYFVAHLSSCYEKVIKTLYPARLKLRPRISHSKKGKSR